MTHDYPLPTHGPHPLADFWQATEQLHAGKITIEQLRERWRREGWGGCIPAELAREMTR